MSHDNFPLHHPDRERASVPAFHEHLRKHVVPAVEAVLPKQPLIFAGEVLRVRRSRSHWLITVRGAEGADPTLGLSIMLPVSEREPEIGQMVNVRGRLQVRAWPRGNLEPFVAGEQRLDQGKRARRYEAQLQLLSMLQSRIEGRQVLELAEPISRTVGLVSGVAADTTADFERGLNPREERSPVAVKRFRTSLDDPATIAQRIRDATNDTDVEVIAIVRGGGDPMGIHCFDDERVLEAIADAVVEKFVLMGIGHADDWSAAVELASHVEDVPQSAGAWLRRRNRQLWWRRREQERSNAAKVAPATSAPRLSWGFPPVVAAPPPSTPMRRGRFASAAQPAQTGLLASLGRGVRRWTVRLALVAIGVGVGWWVRPLVVPPLAHHEQIGTSDEAPIVGAEKDIQMPETNAPRGNRSADQKSKSRPRRPVTPDRGR